MAQIKSFVKNVAFEQGKKISILASSFAYTFLIARLLGPESYGLVIYFISFTASVANVSGVMFLQELLSTFMPRFKSKELLHRLIKYQLFIILPVMAILLLFAVQILGALVKQEPHLFQWAALLLLILPLYTSFLVLCRSFKSFFRSSVAEMLMNFSNLGLAVAMIYFLQTGPIGVIWAEAIAGVLALTLLLYFYRGFSYSQKPVEYQEVKKYSKSALPTSLLNRGWKNFQLILLGLFVNNIALGYYFLVQKVTNAFIGTSASTLSAVLLPYSIEKFDDKKSLGNFISLAVKFSLVFAAGLGLVMVVAAKPVLELFLPEFVEAYTIVPLMALISVANAPVMMNQVFRSVNRFDYVLKAGAISVFVGAVLLYFLTLSHGLQGFLFAILVYYLCLDVLLYVFARKVGVKVELMPRKGDFLFFYNQAKKLISSAFKQKET